MSAAATIAAIVHVLTPPARRGFAAGALGLAFAAKSCRPGQGKTWKVEPSSRVMVAARTRFLSLMK